MRYQWSASRAHNVTLGRNIYDSHLRRRMALHRDLEAFAKEPPTNPEQGACRLRQAPAPRRETGQIPKLSIK